MPEETVERLLNNALRAPSGGFTQGCELLVLTAAADRELFWTLAEEADPCEDDFARAFLERLQRAPLIVVCFSNKEAYLDRYAEADKGFTDRDDTWWPAPYWDIDAGMAALLILLTAVDEHLGACFFAVPKPAFGPLRAAFDVPEAHHPIGAMTLGYPGDDPIDRARFASRRRSAEHMVHRGRWSQSG